MIVTLGEAKQWLRVDFDDDDTLIQSLINAAEIYLTNSTGITFDSSNDLAKLYCLVLVADWYENRELVGKMPGEKARFTIQSITTQLQYAYDLPEETSSAP